MSESRPLVSELEPWVGALSMMKLSQVSCFLGEQPCHDRRICLVSYKDTIVDVSEYVPT